MSNPIRGTIVGVDGYETVRFVVPGPPVPCARARVFKDKNSGDIRAARPKETARYERHVASCARTAAMVARWALRDGDEFRITLEIFRKADRGDWDNYAKSVTDGMNGVLYADDRRIIQAHVLMSIDRKNPRVEVEVSRRRAA